MKSNDRGTLAAVSGRVPRELQQMWLQLVRSEWSSLALIPTDPATSARPIADALLEMAPFYDLSAFKIIDAGGSSLTDGVRVAREVASAVASGARVLVLVDSPMQNGGAVPVIMATDAALLLVRLGSSELESARSVIEIVGRERVLGCVAMHA